MGEYYPRAVYALPSSLMSFSPSTTRSIDIEPYIECHFSPVYHLRSESHIHRRPLLKVSPLPYLTFTTPPSNLAPPQNSTLANALSSSSPRYSPISMSSYTKIGDLTLFLHPSATVASEFSRSVSVDNTISPTPTQVHPSKFLVNLPFIQ